MNNLILVWEAETCKHLYKFTGHKGPVSVRTRPSPLPAATPRGEHVCLSVLLQGLSFRTGTHDLYSASHDRSVKVWNVDENAYVETL